MQPVTRPIDAAFAGKFEEAVGDNNERFAGAEASQTIQRQLFGHAVQQGTSREQVVFVERDRFAQGRVDQSSIAVPPEVAALEFRRQAAAQLEIVDAAGLGAGEWNAGDIGVENMGGASRKWDLLFSRDHGQWIGLLARTGAG